MPKILVLFASKNDSHVYEEIIRLLKKNRMPFEIRIGSAHKNPEDVSEIIKNSEYEIIISGAGLSAALPGVIASKSIKPVIGVPINNNYQGLDSLLAIAQMPPGVPVLAVGVNNSYIAVMSAINMMMDYEGVTIISDEENHDCVKNAVAILKEFGINYKFDSRTNKNTVNLEFVYFDEQIEKKDELVIYCPLVLEGDNNADAALNFLKHTTHGLWVGLNNGTNSALATIQILNKNGNYTNKLIEYREKLKKRLREDDVAIKNLSK